MRTIYTEEICVFASEVLGEEAGSEGVLKALCEAASTELLARLREGTNVESIKPLFVTAAGVLALSMYVAVGDEGTKSVKAGNMAISTGGRAASAHSLRKQAEAMIAAYVKDCGFEFRSVE